MNQRTRKLMMMHKALRPRDDVNRLCQEGKEEEESSIQYSIDASIQWLEDYIKKVRWKSDYSDQKQYTIDNKHSAKQNTQKKIGRKTIGWIFQVKNRPRATK